MQDGFPAPTILFCLLQLFVCDKGTSSWSTLIFLKYINKYLFTPEYALSKIESISKDDWIQN